MKTYRSSIYGILAIMILLSSCCLGDVVINYEYRVTNNSETPVTILVTADDSTSLLLDSIFIIEVGQTQTVVETEGGIVNACQKIEYNPENINRDLEAFSVTNRDSILSSRNYLNSEEWLFDEGTYTITVEQSEF